MWSTLFETIRRCQQIVNILKETKESTMGTRGLITIITKKRITAVYNYFDSYPTALGTTLVEEIRNYLKIMTVQDLAEKLYNLKVVTKETEPPTDIKNLETWTLSKIIDCGYIFDSNQRDCNIFIEYNYILDFDNEKFSVEPLDLVFPLSEILPVTDWIDHM